MGIHKKTNIKSMDLTGAIVGHWQVKSIAYVKKTIPYWTCVCICGEESQVQMYRLFHGKTKSCGCKESIKSNTYRPKDVVDFRSRQLKRKLQSYKFSARNRGLTFDLSDSEFEELVFSNCYYCGRKPSRPSVSKKIIGHGLLFNGIDRKINAEGYTQLNSVSCCTECNFLKGSRDHDNFISLCKLISLNMRRKTRKKGT